MNYISENTQIINDLKSALDQLKPFSEKNQRKLDEKIRLEFNYNSNHLEGNTLTYGQTQLLLLYDKSSGDVAVSDLEEMKAHDVALSQIKALAGDRERPLTETFIKELNKTILVQPFWKDAISPNGTPTRKKIEIGRYKTTPNSVMLKNGEIHQYASPEETPALVRDLIIWYHKNSPVLHPVQLAALFHYKFVCIHPFDDGNGRVARLLMNYILLRHDYPIVIIKSVDKEKYLTALQKADTGDILALTTYIEEQAIAALKLSIKAGKGEDIEEKDDLDKQLSILKRAKLTKTTIYKTPKVSYDLIMHIRNDVWSSIDQLLAKFNDFFSEMSDDIYINQNKYIETKTINPFIGFSALSKKEVEIKPSTLYGKDLSKEVINTITWTKKLHSLKSASTKKDFEISGSLVLKDASYEWQIFEVHENGTDKNKTVLFNMENKYSSFFMNDMIDTMKKEISNHLLFVIKNAI